MCKKGEQAWPALFRPAKLAIKPSEEVKGPEGRAKKMKKPSSPASVNVGKTLFPHLHTASGVAAFIS